MQSNLSNYAELFAADEEWLSRQHGMSDFHQGCSELVGRMNEWIKHYTADICGQSVNEETTQHTGYLRRVWGCWRHNWKKAAGDGVADGHEIAAKIRGQQPATDKANTGSDLIHDVILVEAVLGGNDLAIIYFDRIHNDVVNRLAARSDAPLKSDRSWWQDTMSRLVGTPLKLGALNAFIGKGALLTYTERAIGFDLIRESTKLQRERDRLKSYGEGVVGIAEHTPTEDAVTNDCHSLYRNACRDALDDSPASDRAAAQLLLAERLKPTEVAAALEIHPATPNRILKRIFGRIRDLICQPNGELSSVFRDCGEHLFGNCETAVRLLREVIEEDYVTETQS